jgi:hypothetical protein
MSRGRKYKGKEIRRKSEKIEREINMERQRSGAKRNAMRKHEKKEYCSY